MKCKLALLFFLAAGIVNANDSNSVTNPIQANLDISVAGVRYDDKWTLVCNQNGEVDGNYPQKEAVCSELGQLQVSLNEAIENGHPVGPCVLIYEPVKLIINGMVDGKETQVVKESPNSCVLKRTLADAGVPNLVPFDEYGSFNVGNN